MNEEYPEVVTPDGEVLTEEQVRFAYTREGRRVVGKEYPNPVPMEAPIGFVPMKPLHEQIREMVLREIGSQAEREGFESAEEAEDFEIGDDYDPASPWELDFEPDHPWPGNPAVIAAEEAALAARGEGGAEPPPDSPKEAAPPPPPAKTP